MDWNYINNEFEGIKDVSYLNICSIGPVPRCVEKAHIEFMKKRVDTYGATVMEDGRDLIKDAKIELAHMINCDKKELGITTSTATGMGLFIGGYPFNNGDNVIISDQEFPSTILGFIPLKKKGVELRTIKPRNGYLDIEDFKNAIDENTRAIVVSAVQFTNGFYIDLVRLGALCKMYNIMLVVDAIQAIGRLNVDVKKMNISFLSCGGFKGLLSTVGVGFIYCKEELMTQLEPISASYTNVKYDLKPPIMDYDLNKVEWFDGGRRFEAGHINYIGVAGLHAACKLINTIGIDNIEKHVLNLQHKLLNDIKDISLSYMTPEMEENYSGIFSFYYPKERWEDVNGIMDTHKIITTISENGYIRVGIGLYNTVEDIDNLVIALKKVSQL